MTHENMVAHKSTAIAKYQQPWWNWPITMCGVKACKLFSPFAIVLKHVLSQIGANRI